MWSAVAVNKLSRPAPPTTHNKCFFNESNTLLYDLMLFYLFFLVSFIWAQRMVDREKLGVRWGIEEFVWFLSKWDSALFERERYKRFDVVGNWRFWLGDENSFRISLNLRRKTIQFPHKTSSNSYGFWSSASDIFCKRPSSFRVWMTDGQPSTHNTHLVIRLTEQLLVVLTLPPPFPRPF
jgi:hypothetical protein